MSKPPVFFLFCLLTFLGCSSSTNTESNIEPLLKTQLKLITELADTYEGDGTSAEVKQRVGELKAQIHEVHEKISSENSENAMEIKAEYDERMKAAIQRSQKSAIEYAVRKTEQRKRAND